MTEHPTSTQVSLSPFPVGQQFRYFHFFCPLSEDLRMQAFKLAWASYNHPSYNHVQLKSS